MKIVVLSVFAPFRGGIAQFNSALCQTLEQQGHDVVRLNFTTLYPGFLFPGKTQFIDGCETPNQKSPRTLSSINPLTWISTRKKIRQENPDLIIAPYWSSYLAPSLTFAIGKQADHAFKLGLIHNAIPHEEKAWDKYFISRFLNPLNATVSLSEKVSEQICALHPSLNRITLPHPIYTHFGERKSAQESEEFIKTLGLNPKKKTLLFFGLIREYKGLKILLKAFDLLSEDFQLIIAGECYDQIDPYLKLINTSSKKNNIKLVNEFISDEEVPNYFSAADAVILPYLNATQSGVTAIAMHFEVPVIASNVGGLEQFVQHNQTGLLVEPNNVQALGDSITRWFSASRKESKGEIKKWALNFTWDQFSKNLIQFVEQD